MQLDELWQFMQVDMEADRFENKMRQSENRQKLLEAAQFPDGTADQYEEAGERTSPSCRIAWRPCATRRSVWTSVLATAAAEIEANPPATAEDGDKPRRGRAEAGAIRSCRYEQELQKMRKDAEAKDRQQKEIRVRAAKTKVGVRLSSRSVYDKEFKKPTPHTLHEDARTTSKRRLRRWSRRCSSAITASSSIAPRRWRG